MGAAIEGHDWSTSPLGQPSTWSSSLRAVVGLMLSSKFPMFIAWGDELSFLYNDGYVEVLGSKHPDALGNRFEDIWFEIWDEVEPIAQAAMNGEASYHENLPLIMKRNGFDEQTWFTFSYSPVFDDSGKVAGIFCVCTETTEQVLADRLADAEHERLRNLFQAAPGIIAVLRGPTHIFDIANDSYCNLVGRRDLIGKPFHEALPEVVDQGFVEILNNVFQSGKPYVGTETSVLLQREPEQPLEQRFVNFVFQPTIDLRGNVSGIFIEGSDVTYSVNAFQALRDSEAQLRLMANTIPHLAWMANPDGWIHWYNDRWYDFTGTTAEDMEGWGWRKVHHPDTLALVEEKWLASINSGQSFELTFPLRGGDGSYRIFFTRVVPLHDSAGIIVQWFGTNTDVTEIENAREELGLANQRKDEFLAMLAHELRNPLAPISTAAGLLKLFSQDEARVRSTSEIIARQVQHMSKLLDDLLDVSRVTRGVVTLQMSIFDIGRLLRDAVEQTQGVIESKNHSFDFKLPEEQLLVRGDRTRLVQVFSNVLNNAAKFTQPNGRIRLHARVQGEQIVVDVEDNGPGIEAGLLPHVFDLFTQADRTPGRTQGGLGLGLALVKNLVQLHDGIVSAHSDGSGRGARFTISLPVVTGSDGQKVRSVTANTTVARPGTADVLVVDDNKDAAEVLMYLIESAGHRVSVAHSAREALEALSQVPPSVIFLDIGLPDIDGFELAKQIRGIPALTGVLLVAVTGYGQVHDRERAFAAGFDHHLVKPVHAERVLNFLEPLPQLQNSVASSTV